jgi:hypothetical protein
MPRCTPHDVWTIGVVMGLSLCDGVGVIVFQYSLCLHAQRPTYVHIGDYRLICHGRL